MIVADILMWFLLVMGIYIVFNSYWLASQGLFPDFADRRRQRIRTAPFNSIFAGGFPTDVAALLIILVLSGLAGSSGLAAQIGAGLASPADQSQAWRRVLRGGIVLGLTFILPVAGWFLILPVSLIMGCGAALRSSFAVTER